MSKMSVKYHNYLESKDKEWLIEYIAWCESQIENLSQKLEYAQPSERIKVHEPDVIM